jgi:hypothetical protein
LDAILDSKSPDVDILTDSVLDIEMKSEYVDEEVVVNIDGGLMWGDSILSNQKRVTRITKRILKPAGLEKEVAVSIWRYARNTAIELLISRNMNDIEKTKSTKAHSSKSIVDPALDPTIDHINDDDCTISTGLLQNFGSTHHYPVRESASNIEVLNKGAVLPQDLFVSAILRQKLNPKSTSKNIQGSSIEIFPSLLPKVTSTQDPKKSNFDVTFGNTLGNILSYTVSVNDPDYQVSDYADKYSPTDQPTQIDPPVEAVVLNDSHKIHTKSFFGRDGTLVTTGTRMSILSPTKSCSNVPFVAANSSSSDVIPAINSAKASILSSDTQDYQKKSILYEMGPVYYSPLPPTNEKNNQSIIRHNRIIDMTLTPIVEEPKAVDASSLGSTNSSTRKSVARKRYIRQSTKTKEDLFEEVDLKYLRQLAPVINLSYTPHQSPVTLENLISRV